MRFCHVIIIANFTEILLTFCENSFGFIPSASHAGGLRYHGMSSTVSELYDQGLLTARSVEQTEVFKAAQTFNGLGVNALQHDRLSDLGAATTMNDNTVDIRKKLSINN